MDPAPQPSAPFPRPPPFYQQFTKDNLKQLEQLRKQKRDEGGEEELRLEEVPAHLQYLLPPPPPTGTYTVFGEEQDQEASIPPLPYDIERINPDNLPHSDRPAYLTRILKSILLKFLELVGTLFQDPEYAKPKAEDLRVLFFNAYRLINELRPHQARESLIAMMEAQVVKKREEVAGVKKLRERVDGLLGSFGEVEMEDVASKIGGKMDQETRALEQNKAEQRATWRTLEAIEI